MLIATRHLACLLAGAAGLCASAAKPLDRCWITHEEIMRGGVLRFRLGPKRNEKWAKGGIPAA
jgi:hypothetical protein